MAETMQGLFLQAQRLFGNGGLTAAVQNRGSLQDVDDLVEVGILVTTHIQDVCRWHRDLVEAYAAGNLDVPKEGVQ